MTIISVFNRYASMMIEYRALQERAVARIGHQPKRTVFDAVLLSLFLDECDGYPTATAALDALLVHETKKL